MTEPTPGTVLIEGGHVLANVEERTITGLLIPYNEVGRTNVGQFQVEAGSVALPSDPIVVSINTDHVRHENVGRASRVWEQAEGVMATFDIARTPEGDAALAEATSPDGRRRRLSAEFGPAVIHAGRLVAGHARLWGAALVERGAFPSAMVLASDTPTTDAHRGTTEGDPMTEPTVAAPAAPVETPPAAPAAPAVPSVGDLALAAAGIQPVQQQAPAMALAAAQPIPAVQTAGVPTAPAARTGGDELQQVLAALATLKMQPSNADALHVLAAITDVTMSGVNPLPGSGVVRPLWLDKLYQGVSYIREFIVLGNLGNEISLAGKGGFRVNRGTAGQQLPPQDGSWFGNKQPINGYPGNSSTLWSTLYRFVFGNDYDRTMFDLPGAASLIQEFLELIVEDGLAWSDRIARETFITAAGAPVAAIAYPAIYTTNGTTALGQLIQGILAVRKRKVDGRRDQPTFAIANDVAFAQLAYATGGDQNLPAFINLSLASLDLPQAAIGSVGPLTVVNGDTGVQATSSVIVGARYGVDFDELPGGPITIDALDIARGGVDKATHAYLQTFVKRPEAFVHVGTADNWTAATAYAVGTPVKNGAAILQAQPSTTLPLGSATAGTSAGAAPANPAVGATVVDGTILWKRLV